jgi:site-specific DNA recombinase
MKSKVMRELQDDSRVIGYARVSTDEQKRNGDGLEVQIKAIENYCAAMRWELIEIVIEDESGATIEKREKFQSILDRLEADEFDGVIVNKLDRFARNLKDLMIMHDDMFLPAGVAMVSIKDKFDTSTPSGRLFFQILGGFAEFERTQITERTMDGITNKARKGQHASGRIALGYKSVMVDGKKHLEVDETEKEIVELIFRLKDEKHMTFRGVADYLNDNGYKPKRWTPDKPVRFAHTSIQSIYKNPKYKGIYTFHRRGEDTIVVENESLRILN